MSSWFPKVEYIWMNGKLISWDDANNHVLTHGAMYGTGVFEGLRSYETAKGPAIFRLGPHMKRLETSAKLLRIPMPFTGDEIGQSIKDTIKANGLKGCYIRPVVSYGYHSLGVHPKECPANVVIAAFPWDNFMGDGAHDKGIRCCISSWVRLQSNMVPSAAKACGPYLNNMLAKMDASDKGFDEAIMLDVYGNVAEACTENIFIVRENEIFTPGLENSVLPGITRDSVMKLARDAGYTLIEKNLSVGELLTADEVFLTGSAAEITPVREIDFRVIGEGTVGTVTKDLQERFFKVIKGQDDRYADWLDIVGSE